jgi:assimilatory nitrate reductase catalytic subunit
MPIRQDGTMTYLDGPVLQRLALPKPAPGLRTDLAVQAELSLRLGGGARLDGDPCAAFEELRRASAGGLADSVGVTWPRVDAEGGAVVPCPSTGRPSTPRLFRSWVDGRARRS